MIKGFYHRGQAFIEYAMVIACIAAALMIMQIYIKRAVQGRFRESADSIGEHYAPGRMNSEITITQTGSTIINTELKRDPDNPATKLGLETATVIDETTSRTGYENTGKFENKLFD